MLKLNDEEICTLMLLNLKEFSSYHIVPTLVSNNHLLPPIEMISQKEPVEIKELPKQFIPCNPLEDHVVNRFMTFLDSENSSESDYLLPGSLRSSDSYTINTSSDEDENELDDIYMYQNSSPKSSSESPNPLKKKQKTKPAKSTCPPPSEKLACHYGTNCVLCSKGKPKMLEKSPTWATIMKVVFYSLTFVQSTSFFSLKNDVYRFIETHWELLSLDKKKCDNWHKQIQDMLSHSKATFESGSESLGQNGYWKLRNCKIDPWLEGIENGDRSHVPNLNSSQSRTHPYARSPRKSILNEIEQQIPILISTPKSFNISSITD